MDLAVFEANYEIMTRLLLVTNVFHPDCGGGAAVFSDLWHVRVSLRGSVACGGHNGGQMSVLQTALISNPASAVVLAIRLTMTS